MKEKIIFDGTVSKKAADGIVLAGAVFLDAGLGGLLFGTAAAWAFFGAGVLLLALGLYVQPYTIDSK